MKEKPLSIFELFDTFKGGGATLPEERLRAIENFPLIEGKHALYIVDWKNAEVVYSRGLHAMLGYEEEKKSATELIKNYHPDDELFVHRIIRGTVRHFIEHTAKGLKEYLNLTYRLQKKNGSYIKVLRQSTVFRLGTEGKPIMNMSLITDISFISNNNKVEWDVYASHLNTEKLKEQVYQEFINFFTERERQVIQCMAEGLTNVEIAKKLHISKHTVGTHRKNMMAKAKSSNALELLEFCRKNGIL